MRLVNKYAGMHTEWNYHRYGEGKKYLDYILDEMCNIVDGCFVDNSIYNYDVKYKHYEVIHKNNPFDSKKEYDDTLLIYLDDEEYTRYNRLRKLKELNEI